jgi:uncharacterized protein YdeI (YjbR/CyaY-like superfamily)
MPRAGEHLTQIEITSRAALRAWLEAHHGQRESVWVVTHKAVDPTRHVPAAVVCEEALCFGWIDSLPRKLDAARTMLLISPRKPGSGWSKVNKDRIERLTAEGRMAEPGLDAVARAKADGSWTKLDAVDALLVPGDLIEAFARHPGSEVRFAAFPPSARRGILERIAQAKRPETRAARVEETARLAAGGVRANQYRRPKAD